MDIAKQLEDLKVRKRELAAMSQATQGPTAVQVGTGSSGGRRGRSSARSPQRAREELLVTRPSPVGRPSTAGGLTPATVRINLKQGQSGKVDVSSNAATAPETATSNTDLQEAVGQCHVSDQELAQSMVAMERKMLQAQFRADQAEKQLWEVQESSAGLGTTDERCARYATELVEALEQLKPLKQQVKQLERDAKLTGEQLVEAQEKEAEARREMLNIKHVADALQAESDSWHQQTRTTQDADKAVAAGQRYQSRIKGLETDVEKLTKDLLAAEKAAEELRKAEKQRKFEEYRLPPSDPKAPKQELEDTKEKLEKARESLKKEYEQKKAPIGNERVELLQEQVTKLIADAAKAESEANTAKRDLQSEQRDVARLTKRLEVYQGDSSPSGGKGPLSRPSGGVAGGNENLKEELEKAKDTIAQLKDAKRLAGSSASSPPKKTSGAVSELTEENHKLQDDLKKARESNACLRDEKRQLQQKLEDKATAVSSPASPQGRSGSKESAKGKEQDEDLAKKLKKTEYELWTLREQNAKLKKEAKDMAVGSMATPASNKADDKALKEAQRRVKERERALDMSAKMTKVLTLERDKAQKQVKEMEEQIKELQKRNSSFLAGSAANDTAESDKIQKELMQTKAELSSQKQKLDKRDEEMLQLSKDSKDRTKELEDQHILQTKKHALKILNSYLIREKYLRSTGAFHRLQQSYALDEKAVEAAAEKRKATQLANQLEESAKTSQSLVDQNKGLKDVLDEEASEHMTKLATAADLLKEVFDAVDAHETGVASRVDLKATLDKFVYVGGQKNMLGLSKQVANLNDIVVEREEFEEIVRAWEKDPQ